MRPWDNFFWWLEVNGMPEKSMVCAGELAAAADGAAVSGASAKWPSGISCKCSRQAAQTIVWLGPEMVDFDQPLSVELNGRKMTPANKPVVAGSECAA